MESNNLKLQKNSWHKCKVLCLLCRLKNSPLTSNLQGIQYKNPNLIVYKPTGRVIKEALKEIRVGVNGDGETNDVRIEAALMKMNSISVEELTYQEKCEFLCVLGRKLSEFTSEANKEENIFQFLNCSDSCHRCKIQKKHKVCVKYCLDWWRRKIRVSS